MPLSKCARNCTLPFNVDQSVGGLLAVDKGWLVMGAYAVVLAVAAWAVYRKRLGGGGR